MTAASSFGRTVVGRGTASGESQENGNEQQSDDLFHLSLLDRYGLDLENVSKDLSILKEKKVNGRCADLGKFFKKFFRSVRLDLLFI